MTSHDLRSPGDAERYLANVFRAASDCSAERRAVILEVREDECFQKDKWVAVGSVSAHGEPGAASTAGPESDGLDNAIRYGAYDWTLPPRQELLARFGEAVPSARNGSKSTAPNPDRWLDQVVDSVPLVGVRCGLSHPLIDPGVFSEMPFETPVSVVVDTTAVFLGGLDFLARHLAPAARIRIPAIVHVEILDMADRFFSRRRSGNRPTQALAAHMMSQGGQRVLLRLAISPHVEIERAVLDPDPIRGAFRSKPADDQKNLSSVVRSFADRLILETAIRHRDRVVSNHPVMLMTGDQGLARTARAEGITPLFLSPKPRTDLFGSTRSGAVFAPFRSAASVAHTALSVLLWEFAAAFGRARLRCESAGAYFEVVAMDRDLGWNGFHVEEDLMWTRFHGGTKPTASAARSEVLHKPKPKRTPRSAEGAYSFSASKMLALMQKIASASVLDGASALSAEGISGTRSKTEYGGFLIAGGFARWTDWGIEKTGILDQLLEAMRNSDWDAVREHFLRVPSLERLWRTLRVGNPITARNEGVASRGFRNYCDLLEASRAALHIHDEGAYATPADPKPHKFAESALRAYDHARNGRPYALTGSWLEELARQDGIHPLNAKERLEQAQAAGVIHRYFEGSTPESRYDAHRFCALLRTNGELRLERILLYRGDFLMPGKSTVSIRLVRGHEA